jgi:hypothetical protein
MLLQGDTEGFARFRSPEDAAAALAKAPGGELAVESATVKLALMTGSEEDTILEAVRHIIILTSSL